MILHVTGEEARWGADFVHYGAPSKGERWIKHYRRFTCSARLGGRGRPPKRVVGKNPAMPPQYFSIAARLRPIAEAPAHDRSGSELRRGKFKNNDTEHEELDDW
jgi:hypothetical protein